MALRRNLAALVVVFAAAAPAALAQPPDPACQECGQTCPSCPPPPPICRTPRCNPPPPPPLPPQPLQTPTQIKLIAAVDEKAKKASEKAKPQILAWLDSLGFLAELDGCCADIKAMSAKQRLEWIDAELAAAEMVHNFGTQDGQSGPQSDETIKLGMNASFFYNLWEIALIGDEKHPKPPPPPPDGPPKPKINCTVVNEQDMCGEGGNCTSVDAKGDFHCKCFPGWRKPKQQHGGGGGGGGGQRPGGSTESCDEKIPLDCKAQQSQQSCENVTGQQDTYHLPDCKWVSADGKCVILNEHDGQSGGGGGRQTTDVAEVGLFGFPEFANASESAGYGKATYTLAEAAQRPIYTDFSNRKVDVGNPMFGEISAIFTPSFVRNMTLIAPIDTGAWEGECNQSNSQGFQRATDDKTCAAVTKESGCNGEDQANPGKFIMCDWRKTKGAKGGDGAHCVNSALDRLQCYHATDAASCKAAPGLPQHNDYSPHQSLSHLWNQELYNGGCAWDGSKSECVAFTCETLPTQAACHLAAHPPPPNCSNPAACRDQHYEMPKHCTWDNTKSVCAHTNPAQYCEAQLHPDKPGGGGRPMPGPPMPPQPPPPPFELCTEGEGLCMWEGKGGNRTATEGKCVPTHCDKIHNETVCNEKNEGYGISCAWVNSTSEEEGAAGDDDVLLLSGSGKCITFNENCSLLPTEASCNHMHACAWNHTGKDHSGPTACEPVGGGPSPMGGWEFNCS